MRQEEGITPEEIKEANVISSSNDSIIKEIKAKKREKRDLADH